MSYEFNPRTQQYELPNPHRVENQFLIVTGVVLFCMGAAGLMAARDALMNRGLQGAESSVLALLPAALILIFSIAHLGRWARQLRFYFGRDQGAQLAPELGRDKDGETPEALELRERLRQNALSYNIPVRALDTLLYTLIPDLIFAPSLVRAYAERQFHNALVLGLVLILFMVAGIGLPPAQSTWIGLFYFALTAFILRPQGLASGRLAAMGSGVKGFIGLMIVSIVGPALVMVTVTTPAPFSELVNYGALTVLLLLLGLVAALLFLIALRQHTLRPDSASATAALDTVSMNSHPNQLLLECEREMQRVWTDGIPNRSYLRKRPEVSGEAGSFEGELLEETQPVPFETRALSLSSALAAAEYRWLVLLDAYALIASLAGGACLLKVSQSGGMQPNLILAGLALLVAGSAAFTGSKWLWRRFRFTSRIYWVEMKGSFQIARMDYGNVLHDRVKTQKQLINIEDMTLRVWVTEIDSVSFETNPSAADRKRYPVAMRGLPDEAERVTRLLADFGRAQSAIVAPSANRDAARVAALRQLEAVSSAHTPAALSQAPAVNAIAAALVAGFCMRCGTALSAGVLFCDNCGVAVAAPVSGGTR